MKVSRFTPSLMKAEDLEAIFVQRHELAADIVKKIRVSVLNAAKNDTLLIGSRGIGKTHLVSLVYHRIRNDDCNDRLLIAWLREEEWGVTSFLDLLLRIFRSVKEEYGNLDLDPSSSRSGEIEGNKGKLVERVESLYELPPDAAERAGVALLKEIIGDRTLLLLMENLDVLFEGLGKDGQKQFRSFLQKNACTILATAQSLFNSVQVKTSPFYNFFNIHHLEDLTVDEATQLLANIAKLDGKLELEQFIQTPTGRDRIKAVHHLAGGNPRIYVIFSEFLTRESLDELIKAFERTLDDLTPYYQSRMAWLSAQQRKIVEFLCDRRQAVTVKEIAQRCFMTHQTASSQLKKLLEMGYVRSEAIGRESYYELRETLMRFCLEVKKQRGEPIRLFVDFLRIWYTPTELEARLEELSPDAALEREYLLHVLQDQQNEDLLVAAYCQDLRNYIDKEDFINALRVVEKLSTIRGDVQGWQTLGVCWLLLENWNEALVSCNKAIDLNPNNGFVWYLRAMAMRQLGDHNEALAACNKAIELNHNDALVWLNRGLALSNLERYEEALKSYDKAIELDLNSIKVWSSGGFLPHIEVWHYRGVALGKLNRHNEAIESFDKAIKLGSNSVQVWNNRGNALAMLGRNNEALTSFEKAIELNPNDPTAWHGRGAALGMLRSYDKALESFDKMIDLALNNALAWGLRGWVLHYLERYEEALASCDKAIELGAQSSFVFFNRAEAILALNRWNEGIAALDKALEGFADVEDKSDISDTQAIIRNLFNSTNDAGIWKFRIITLIEVYDKHQVLSALGKGLVESIPVLISEMFSEKAAQIWLEVWRELTSEYKEFQIPLRLLNAAVEYKVRKGDRRVLLELAIEERQLLEQVLK